VKNLDPIIHLLQTSRHKLIATVTEVPGEYWRKSPGGRWSAAEVVAHVGMVEQAIITRAKKGLQALPNPVSPLKRLYIPVSLAAWRVAKRKSPIPLDPSLVTNRPEALSRLDAAREATLGFIECAREKDLGVYRFPHPFLGSLNLYELVPHDCLPRFTPRETNP
jgi:hypothetical protein